MRMRSLVTRFITLRRARVRHAAFCVLGGALLVAVAGAGARAQADADSGTKSPVLAGVASYFLPGVGSWYAGNDHHARVHGGIAFGLGVVGMGVGMVGDCFELSCKKPAANVVASLVVIGYLTNSIWSTVTAVRDAQAHNERAGLQTGRLEVAPELRVIPAVGDVARWRAAMRVLRVGL